MRFSSWIATVTLYIPCARVSVFSNSDQTPFVSRLRSSQGDAGLVTVGDERQALSVAKGCGCSDDFRYRRSRLDSFRGLKIFLELNVSTSDIMVSEKV